MLAPLQFYAKLQRLGLLPPWPLLPNPLQASYLRPLLSSPRSCSPPYSLTSYASSIALCPLATFCYMTWITDLVRIKLIQYTRASLPRPENPDSLSLKLGTEDGVNMNAPVLELPRLQGSLAEELAKDISLVVRTFHSARFTLGRFWTGAFRQRKATVEFPDPIEDAGQPPTQNVDSVLRRRSTITITEPGPPESPDVSTSLDSDTSFAETPSNILTPTSSNGPFSPTTLSSNVQIRTRSGSTSTLHMDVEVNAPLRGGPVFTSTFASSPRNQITESSTAQVLNGTLDNGSKKPYQLTTLRASLPCNGAHLTSV